jgi:hypothetical protein
MDTDYSTVQVPILTELGIGEVDDGAGNGETQGFISSSVGKDEGVDTRQFPFHVYQRTTAIAGIDGGVCLNENQWAVGIELPGDGTYHPHRNGVPKSAGTAKAKNDLPMPKLFILG